MAVRYSGGDTRERHRGSRITRARRSGSCSARASRLADGLDRRRDVRKCRRGGRRRLARGLLGPSARRTWAGGRRTIRGSSPRRSRPGGTRGRCSVMEERRLGPVVGLGTYDTFGADERLATEVVGAALEAGATVFDSSPMYGAAEESLGAALRGRRADGIVATKIWAGSIDEGRAQYDAQRRFFGRVEIEQIHNLVAWRAAPAVARGRARQPAGSTGSVSPTGMRAASTSSSGRCGSGRFDTVQIPLNPLERRLRGADPAARGGARDRGHRDAPARRARQAHRSAASPPAGGARAAARLRCRDVGAGAAEMVPSPIRASTS